MAATMFPVLGKPAQLKKFLNLATTITHNSRLLSVSACQNNKEGWFTSLMVRKIEPLKESHSKLLSDKEIIYEMTTHDVKAQYMDDYMKNYEEYVEVIKQRKDISSELVGSWICGVGDQDQAIHLWKHKEGYAGIDESAAILRSQPEYVSIKKARARYLRSRRCQYLLNFSFWPPLKMRTEPHVYEIRSYMLKPGTVIEWGNNWARGIHYRTENDEPFAGFFSHLGVLYNVHHIWAYTSMAARKKIRESAWNKPGWDDCVAYTVPLIQSMESRLLLPTPFSPTR